MISGVHITPHSPRPTTYQDPSIANMRAFPHLSFRHYLRPFYIDEVIQQHLGVTAPRISLIRRLVFGLVHIVAVGVLLGLASWPDSARSILGEVSEPRTIAGQSQWEACQRPLAAWNIVWAVKAVIGTGMAFWDYQYMITTWSVWSKRLKEGDWYSRCAPFLELCGLVWFIVANVLLYGSLTTCRFTSPYIWWLTFELVCWGYMVVLELVVEVVGYSLWMLYNRITTGYASGFTDRHPPPRTQPQGDDSGVPPMSSELVDRILLVAHTPAIVQEKTSSPTQPKPAAGPKPNPTHSPKPDTQKHTRVKLLLFSRKKSEDDPEAMW
ncbi:hypothetical protein FRC09_015595 [Ceratobasidium sp. 395]|nr:hypothetical protein FRC09_015595 [Ceratobasidium sp. 395]